MNRLSALPIVVGLCLSGCTSIPAVSDPGNTEPNNVRTDVFYPIE